MTDLTHLQPSRLIWYRNNGVLDEILEDRHKDVIEKIDEALVGLYRNNGVKIKPTCVNFCPNTDICSHGYCRPHTYSNNKCNEECRKDNL